MEHSTKLFPHKSSHINQLNGEESVNNNNDAVNFMDKPIIKKENGCENSEIDNPEKIEIYTELNGQEIKCESIHIKSERIEDESTPFYQNLNSTLELPDETVNEEKYFYCDVCNFKSKYPGNLRKHNLIHMNIKKFKCKYCSYKCRRSDNLKTHVKRLHEIDVSNLEKPYAELCETTKHFSCLLCPFESRQINLYEQHMYTHGVSAFKRIFKCEKCTYQSTKRDNFAKHKLTHTNRSKKYQCSICNHKSSRKDNLRQHMATHKDPSELMMYKCDFCEFESKYKKSLKKHVVIHKTEKEWYQCGLCPFKTFTKYSLKPHMLRKHKKAADEDGNKLRWWSTSKYVCNKQRKKKTIFMCGFCDYVTENEGEFDGHFASHEDS